VFALIEQPTRGWGDPLVAIPLIGGIVLLIVFLVWEQRSTHPMMPLYLFRSRNFSVGNLTTFTLYAGLGVATFFLVLFLQQVGGYTPIQSGLALLPITVIALLLSRRFGVLADRLGPHLFMGFGPIVAGLGLLLLARTNASADYVSQVLPGVIVFGLGLSATVAPLTATVLGSVEKGHSGLASGVNNAVSRIAGLLAIAALGAVVSGTFQTRLDGDVAKLQLSPPAHAAIHRARSQPLVTTATGVPAGERAQVHASLVDASVYSFRIGMGIAAALAVLGGAVALVGIENPKRRVPCADCPGGALTGAPEVRRAPEPAAAGASGS
jgi:Major Facilitator Superfamily